MDEQARNDVIASHEDDALNKYLDDRDDANLCYKCNKNESYIEFNDEYYCQDCYEDACAYAEYLVECAEEGH